MPHVHDLEGTHALSVETPVQQAAPSSDGMTGDFSATCQPEGERRKWRHGDSDSDNNDSSSILIAESGKRTCPGGATSILRTELVLESDHAGVQVADLRS